jgi:hypothetical protein
MCHVSLGKLLVPESHYFYIPHVSDKIKASFSSDASQEKATGKCEKNGTRHLAHLDQLSVPASHFVSRPMLRVENDSIVSPLQNLVCADQIHNGHLLGCLSTAPAVQTAKARSCQDLGTARAQQQGLS